MNRETKILNEVKELEQSVNYWHNQAIYWNQVALNEARKVDMLTYELMVYKSEKKELNKLVNRLEDALERIVDPYNHWDDRTREELKLIAKEALNL